MNPGSGAPVDSAALWTPYVEADYVETLRANVRERIEPEADRIDR